MIATKPIYRITLALKNKKSRSRLDFKDLIEDLAGAKDEFNALNRDGHRMLLLEPTRKRLYLILKPGRAEAFQQAMLAHFENILKEGFDWQDYCDQEDILQEAIITQSLETSEFGRLLDQLKHGHEMLATLVKKMEEHKDELVLIMAGYSDEMEKMVALNPGLTSRVPHQIHFPDYSEEELYKIFEKQIGKNYKIEQAAAKKLKELFATTVSVCHRQSGNGRFIRNVVERLKMKQGKRLSALESPKQEELLQINLNDVLALLEDRDITEVLGKMDSKLIGF
ncbi:MAG: hypothetical protein ACQES4_11950 [Bacillota bacterium]